MDISVTARNFKVDDKVKKYINKRLQGLSRLYKRIYKCEVILEYEKERRNVEILIYLKRNRIIAKETTTDIFASVDLASETVKKQLRRLKDRVSSKRNRKTVLSRFIKSGSRQNFTEIVPEIEDEPTIMKTDSFADRPMLPDEAKMELEMNGMDFIVFKNSATSETNVLYKRAGGHLGLIEPKF